MVSELGFEPRWSSFQIQSLGSFTWCYWIKLKEPFPLTLVLFLWIKNHFLHSRYKILWFKHADLLVGFYPRAHFLIWKWVTSFELGGCGPWNGGENGIIRCLRILSQNIRMSFHFQMTQAEGWFQVFDFKVPLSTLRYWMPDSVGCPKCWKFYFISFSSSLDHTISAIFFLLSISTLHKTYIPNRNGFWNSKS